jgi:site-specific DNA-adenine methylase
LIAAAQRGASIVMSNSSTPEIEDLYSTPAVLRAHLRIERVQARRAINSRPDARGPIEELVITNTALNVRPRMLKAHRTVLARKRA